FYRIFLGNFAWKSGQKGKDWHFIY
ncbi:hypothetical protein BXA50_13485, partial [Enterococcus faecium]